MIIINTQYIYICKPYISWTGTHLPEACQYGDREIIFLKNMTNFSDCAAKYVEACGVEWFEGVCDKDGWREKTGEDLMVE